MNNIKLLQAVLLLLLLMPLKTYGEKVIIDSGVQIRLAQSLFNSGDFNEAALEYIRFSKLFPEHKLVPKARYKAAVSLYRAGRLNDAVRHFSKIAYNFSNSVYAPNAMFMLSTVYTSMKRIPDAMNTLSNLIALAEDTEVKDRACIKLAWLILGNAQEIKKSSDFSVKPYKRAEKYLSMISEHSDKKSEANALLAKLDKIDTIKKKDPVIAGISAIIPGGGYLYCERYRDALTSFLFNSTMIMAAYESFRQDNYFLGSAVTFVETGFYIGNIYGSISSAHKFNRQKQKGFINELQKKYTHRKKNIGFSGAPVKDGFMITFNVKF